MAGEDDPTLRQLRCCLALAEELHFRRAATRLHVTQPALSQQIQLLEHRLGVQLFDRSSRRVGLTVAGKSLLPLAKKVVDATNDLRDAARQPGRAERLTLGLSENATTLAATTGTLSMIREHHPSLEVIVKVLDLAEQISMLDKGEIDAALLYLPVSDDLHTQPLTTEPRVACVSSSHPLAERYSVRLDELAGNPVVGLTPEVSPSGRCFWAVDPRPDGSPVSYTTHDVAKCEALLTAVAFDGAIAFVPAITAQLYPRPQVRYLPVEDLPSCTFGLAWRASTPEKPQLAALETTCRRLRQRGVPSGTVPRRGGPRRSPTGPRR